jgi:hypothetical protein
VTKLKLRKAISMIRSTLVVLSALFCVGGAVLFYKTSGGLECQRELGERASVQGEYLKELTVIGAVSPFLFRCGTDCSVDRIASEFSSHHHVYKYAGGTGLSIDGVAVCIAKGAVSSVGPEFRLLDGGTAKQMESWTGPCAGK